MTFKERIANNPVVRQFFGLPGQQGSSAFVDFMGLSDPRIYGLYDSYQGIVFAAINTISRSIAAAEWDLTRNSSSADPMRQVLPTHAFLDLIENPHEGLSKFDLMFGSAVFEEIAGEFFWYFPLPTNRTAPPTEVYLLHPSRMKVLVSKETGDVVGYKYKRTAGDDVPLDYDEVLHHHNFNPNNPYRGLGTLQAGLTYAQTEQFSSRFTRNFFKNNGTPAGVVMIDTKNAEEFKKFQRKWKEEYGGVDNAGKVAFLRGQEAKFTKLSLGLNEIDMKALRDLSEDSILKMFGVPRPLLGFADSTGLGRGNVETLEYIYSKYTVDYKLKQFDDTMQIALNRFWPTEKLTVVHRNVIPEDKDAILAEEKALMDVAISRNEIRQRRGLAPRNGLDVLYHAANQLEVDGSDKQGSAVKAIKGSGTIKVITQKKK